MGTLKHKDQINDELDKLLKDMASSDLAKVALDLKSKRSEIEKQLATLSPFLQTNTVKMIIDYATILNAYHSDNTLEDSSIEHIVAATFSVAYAIGQGQEITKILPILAVAGINEKIGKKILDNYKKNKQSNGLNNKATAIDTNINAVK